MAGAYSARKFMEDDFKTCLLSVLQNIFPEKQLDFLSKEQVAGIRSFIFGNDTFVSLPTGHGKSLIFQLAVPLAKKMLEMGKQSTDYPRKLPSLPIILVVAPLNSLISDQIESCKQKNMKASRLIDLPESDGIVDVDFIFTSSEKLQQNLNILSRIEIQLLGVVIDESHCVINW